MKGTGFLRDLVAMPNRKTLIDPSSQAPLPPGWTVVLIVAGTAMAIAIIVALILGLLSHHPAGGALIGSAPNLAHYRLAAPLAKFRA